MRCKISFLLFLSLLLTTSLFSQDLSRLRKLTEEDDNEKYKALLKDQLSLQAKPSTLKQATNLMTSVDENEYAVDSGDEFIIKIDVKGPAYRVFTSIVTPDGYLIIPDVPSISVKDLFLIKAKEKINSILKQNFPDALVESYLNQLHEINIDVLGSVPQPGRITFNSSNRLFDALNAATEPYQNNPKIKFKWKSLSLRQIDLYRNGTKISYDLLRYKALAELTQNPYLKNNDVVFVNFRDSTWSTVFVSGAVGIEKNFEYRPGDRLIDALRFAGGLLPSCDSSRIEVLQFLADGVSTQNHLLSIPADSNYLLKADDRIFARYKYDHNVKKTIEIKGAVKFPGFYSIIDGKTTLTEIITQAGGFTPRASLTNARLIRRKGIISDKELQRLGRMLVEEMNDLEKSYYRLRSRENISLVACDFEKLFLHKQSEEDVLLRDEDLIMVPEILKTVFVSGGVNSPGNVAWDEQRKYRDYIQLASGFNTRARTGNIKIIKGKTGIWLDAGDEAIIEEGDVIFVPEREEIDWYKVFKESLAIASQLATIVIVITNIR